MPQANRGIINSGVIGGDATVTSTRRRIGDEIRVRADHSVVNVKGRMKRVRQNLKGAPALPTYARTELDDVLKELGARVQGVSHRMPAETERVLEALELLSKELSRPKPDQGFLKTAWEGAKNALGVVSDALPEIVGLSKKLAAILAFLPI